MDLLLLLLLVVVVVVVVVDHRFMDEKKLRGFSPQANYTDQATAAYQRS
jgi:hypothetical protein